MKLMAALTARFHDGGARGMHQALRRLAGQLPAMLVRCIRSLDRTYTILRYMTSSGVDNMVNDLLASLTGLDSQSPLSVSVCRFRT